MKNLPRLTSLAFILLGAFLSYSAIEISILRGTPISLLNAAIAIFFSVAIGTSVCRLRGSQSKFVERVSTAASLTVWLGICCLVSIWAVASIWGMGSVSARWQITHSSHIAVYYALFAIFAAVLFLPAVIFSRRAKQLQAA